MSEPKTFPGSGPDDILARSILVVQDEPDAQGPDQQVNAQVLAALQRAAGVNRTHQHPARFIHYTQRLLTMTLAHKKIAASLMIAIGAVALCASLTLFGSVTYAQVAEKQSGKYLAVFGDLKTKEVTAEEVPKAKQ